MTTTDPEMLLPDAATIDFARVHAADDVRALALSAARYPTIDMSLALDQIRGRQIAARKCPVLARRDGIVYPPHLSMEQCSGQRAAAYKLRLARRLLPPGSREQMVDLTGGFGIDFLALSLAFRRATYVELHPRLCAIMRANLSVLHREAQVVCGDGVAWLRQMPHADLIYIDPARRDTAGARTYAIGDCTPDVTAIARLLVDKATWVMVKLSPMLDWHSAVRELGCVAEVHLVSVGGECKEMLLVLSLQAATDTPPVYCVSDTGVCRFDTPDAVPALLLTGVPEPDMCLYEPDAAVMKSGCFGQLCHRYGVSMVAPHSHLFVSSQPVPRFPGRGFSVVSVSPMNKRALRQALAGIAQANIAVRNFPLTVAELRKRLRLADGGSVYVFATTLADRSHVLIICKKIG